MKKIILLLALFTVSVSSLTAQTPCSQFENSGFQTTLELFEDLRNNIIQNQEKLKDIRQWARKNNKAEIELVTNRLEYWAKKYVQFSDKYAKTDLELVCKKLTDEIYYMYDFAALTTFFYYYRNDNLLNIDYSKYK